MRPATKKALKIKSEFKKWWPKNEANCRKLHQFGLFDVAEYAFFAGREKLGK